MAAHYGNRRAETSLNSVLGDDLRNLLDHQDSVRITKDEFDRVIELHSERPEATRARICGYWKKRGCREDANCPFIHG